MHKVNELEERWFRYKFKKVMNPILGVGILSVFATGSYYLYTTSGNDLSGKSTAVLGVTVETNKTVKSETTTFVSNDKKKERQNDVSEKKVVIKKEKILQEIELQPVIPVIDLEKEERISDARVKRVVRNNKHLVKAKKDAYLTPKELAKVNKPKPISYVQEPRKTKKMRFETSSSNYLDIMKEKFSKSKNPREALLLSKAYYKVGDYQGAEKWALVANKLNNGLEESWLLFAKSKVKLGKKDEAINILASYHKRSNSIEAKRLIRQIKTGKL